MIFPYHWTFWADDPDPDDEDDDDSTGELEPEDDWRTHPSLTPAERNPSLR